MNKKQQEYLKRYCENKGYTEEEALTHYIVKCYMAEHADDEDPVVIATTLKAGCGCAS